MGTVDRNSEDEGYSHDTDEERGDESEDFRHAKRRKLPSVSAKDALKPAREHNRKLDVGRPPRCLTSPTFVQIEMDDRQFQTEDPRFTDNERPGPLPPSRSPSATAELRLTAEYEE